MSEATTPILTPKQISSYYKWSIWARPILTYALTTVMCVVCLTVCIMLAIGKVNMVDTSALLMTIVGAIAPILTGVVVGKSWERGRGNSDEDAAWGRRPNEDHNPSIPSVQGEDPMAVLNSLNLDPYLPKVADDQPVVQ